MTNLKRNLLVWTIPVLLLVVVSIYASGRVFHYGSNSDPEYAYLFNSLSLLCGRAPAHVDHPGTPLQALGAIVVYLRGLVAGNAAPAAVVESAMRSPENYLHAIHLFLVLLVCLSIVAASYRLLSSSKSLLTVLVFQFAILCQFQLQFSLLRVSPEPLLIAVTFLLATVLTPVVFGVEEEGPPGTAGDSAVVAGAVIGLGIAVKVTFFPLLLLILLYDGTRRKLWALAAVASSFFVATLPIASRYLQLGHWLLTLLTHKGRYGSGGTGLPDAGTLLASLKMLVQENAFLFVVLACLPPLVVLMRRPRGAGRQYRLLCLAAAVLALQVAITVKHPASHYLVPSIALSAYVVAVAVGELRAAGRIAAHRCAVVLIGCALAWNGYAISRFYASAAETARNSDRLLRVVNAIPGSIKVGYYRSSLPGFALAFGNDWSGRLQGAALERLFPDTIIYEMWLHRFQRLGGSVLDDGYVTRLIAEGRPVVMVGSNVSMAKETRLICDRIYSCGDEGIYRLRGIRADAAL